MNSDFWQTLGILISIIAAWSLIIISSLRVMFGKSFKNIDEKLAAFSETTKKCFELERELLELKADLPAAYVRREDFIRFDVCINQKLDKLRDMISTILRGKKYEQS